MEIFSTLYSIGAIVLIFTIVVGFHEYGHFLAARICGIPVKVFSIGFGKPLWCTTSKNGTEWRFGWIPLGGYIKMDASYAEKSPLKDIVISFAGPLFSIAPILLLFWGGSAIKHGAVESTAMLFTLLGDVMTDMAGFFINLITFQPDMEHVGGPVKIGSDIAQASQEGGIAQLAWKALVLSFGIGVINLLPLPPLDGGRIVVATVRLLIGQKWGGYVANGLTYLGLGFLLYLFALVMYKDINGLF